MGATGSIGSACAEMIAKEQIIKDQAYDIYLGQKVKVDNDLTITFDDKLTLLRALVKYGAALDHTRKMFGWIETECANRPFEVEMSVDETETPTTPLEHLFIGLELKRLNIKLISLAPRFIGDFEKTPR